MDDKLMEAYKSRVQRNFSGFQPQFPPSDPLISKIKTDQTVGPSHSARPFDRVSTRRVS